MTTSKVAKCHQFWYSLSDRSTLSIDKQTEESPKYSINGPSSSTQCHVVEQPEIKRLVIPTLNALTKRENPNAGLVNARDFRVAIVSDGFDDAHSGYFVLFNKESYLYRGKVTILSVRNNCLINCGFMKKRVEPGCLVNLYLKGKRGFEREMLREHDIMCPWLLPSYPDGCEQCAAKPYEKTLKLCSGCKSVYYCSKYCQKRNWNKVHRNECQTRYSWGEPFVS